MRRRRTGIGLSAAVLAGVLASPAAAADRWTFSTTDVAGTPSFMARVGGTLPFDELALTCSRFAPPSLAVALWNQAMGTPVGLPPGGTVGLDFTFHKAAMFSRLSPRFDATQTLHVTAAVPSGGLGSAVVVKGADAAEVATALATFDSVEVAASGTRRSFTLDGAGAAIGQMAAHCPAREAAGGAPHGTRRVSFKDVFSVAVPGELREIDLPLRTPAGSFTMRGLAAQAGPRSFMAVFYDDDSSFPPDERMAALDNLRRSVTTAGGGTVTRVGPLSGVGDAGEEFTLSLPSGTVQQYRLVLSGSRIFILMTAGPTVDPDAARSFFETLRF